MQLESEFCETLWRQFFVMELSDRAARQISTPSQTTLPNHVGTKCYVWRIRVLPGPRFIRSGRGGSRPDDFAWILSGFSPILVQFCENFCPDYHFFVPFLATTTFEFACRATFVRTMHLFCPDFPPSIFPKFDEICSDQDISSE